MGIKKQLWEVEDEGERERNKGEGIRIFVPEGKEGQPQDREEIDMTHRQMAVYKGKRGNPMLG